MAGGRPEHHRQKSYDEWRSAYDRGSGAAAICGNHPERRAGSLASAFGDGRDFAPDERLAGGSHRPHIQSDRAHEAWRHTAADSSADARTVAPAGRRLSGDQQEPAGRADRNQHAAAGRDVQREVAGRSAAGGGCAGAVCRLRQRGQLVAGAVRRAKARNPDACRAGGHAYEPGSPAAGGQPGDFGDRGSARFLICFLQPPTPD